MADATTLACIRCGRLLESVTPGHPVNQPAGGTTFHSYGQYGSTVWDMVNGEYLEVNVCDPCLLAAAREGRVLRYTPRHAAPPPADSRLWDGEPGGC